MSKLHLVVNEDPLPKNVLFRFRPLKITSRKDVVSELRNREIFFASLDENNDPTEGMFSPYWQGTPLVWRYTIRKYLYTLGTMLIVGMVGPTEKIEKAFQYVFGFSILRPKKKLRVMDRYVDKILNTNQIIKNLIQTLGTNRYSYQEIVEVFAVHNMYFLQLITQELLKKDPNNSLFKSCRDLYPEKYVLSFELSPSEPKIASNKIHQAKEFSILKSLSEQKIPFRGRTFKRILYFEKYFFSSWVFASIPRKYVCCFCQTPVDASLWGYYAEKHKGICLIFDSDTITSKIIKNSKGQTPTLNPIKYVTRTKDINIFKCLRNLTSFRPNEWFGNVRDRRDPLISFYQDRLKSSTYIKEIEAHILTHKLNLWAHEQETRMTMLSINMLPLPIDRRLYHYHPSLLKGIVFGIKTPLDYKIKIIKLLLKQQNRCKFYQAQFESKKSKIKIVPLLKIADKGYDYNMSNK